MHSSYGLKVICGIACHCGHILAWIFWDVVKSLRASRLPS